MVGTKHTHDALLPPLNDTSFSEQYKTFKAVGGFGEQKQFGYGGAVGGNLDMSRDLKQMINPNIQNRPFVRRNIVKPMFTDDANNPLMQTGQIPMANHPNLSVF